MQISIKLNQSSVHKIRPASIYLPVVGRRAEMHCIQQQKHAQIYPKKMRQTYVFGVSTSWLHIISE